MDGIDVLHGGQDFDVVDNVTEVSGQRDLGGLVAEVAKLLVGGLEGVLHLGGDVKDKDGLIDLNLLSTGSLELSQKVSVEWHETLDQVDRVNVLATVGLSESQEGNGTEQNGSGGDTKLKGFLELNDGLRVGVQLELLVLLESGFDLSSQIR